MSGEIENIDGLYKSELQDFAPSPPAGAWENIEKQLALKNTRKAFFTWQRIAASVAMLLATGTLGYYLLTNAPNTQMQTAVNEVQEDVTPPTNESNFPIVKVADETTIRTTPQNTNIPAGTISTTSATNEAANSTQSGVNLVNNTAPIHEEKEEPFTEIPAEENIKLAPISSAPIAQNKTQQSIIYQQPEQQSSEAYEAFLSEFESPEDNGKDFEKWAIGGQAGPQYTYRQVTSDQAVQELLDLYDQSENGLMAYAGGINIAYKPAKRLSIQSGIYYSKMGQSSPATVINNYNDVVGGIIEDPSRANSDYFEATPPELRISSSLGEIQDNKMLDRTFEENDLPTYDGVNHVEQHLEYLEVPLMARYAIIDRKVNFHLLGGVSTNFLIASPVYLSDGSYYTETKDLNSVNYSSTVGLGLGYNFSSFALSIEPQFKYYLNKVNTGASTDVHPYSFGVFTGVTYLF